MPPAVIKQIVVVILALIGLADAHWGTQLVGANITEAITILVTLALAALGLTEMRTVAQMERRSSPIQKP